MDHRVGLSGIGDGSGAHSPNGDAPLPPEFRLTPKSGHDRVVNRTTQGEQRQRGVRIGPWIKDGRVTTDCALNFFDVESLINMRIEDIEEDINAYGATSEAALCAEVPVHQLKELHNRRPEVRKSLTTLSQVTNRKVTLISSPGSEITVTPGETNLEYRYLLKNGEPTFSEPQEEKQSRWPIGKNKSSDQETSKIVTVTENERGAFFDCPPNGFKSYATLDNHFLFALGSLYAVDKKCLPEERVVEIARSMTSGSPDARIIVAVTKELARHFQQKYGDAGTERLENHCRYIEELANNSIKRRR